MTACKSNPGETGLAIKQQENSWCRPASRPVTWTGILIAIGFSAIAALGLYAATVALLIDPYILKGSEAGRVIGIYRAYQTIRSEHAGTAPEHDLVLFWGSSMIREAVDAAMLEKAAPNISAYNLAVSGDLPQRRLTEIAACRDARPTEVVIGVSYPELFEDRPPYEDQIAILPAESYSHLPPEAQSLLSARSRDIMQRSNWLRFWWKRKFFLSAGFFLAGIPDRSNPNPPGYVNNVKAPWVYRRSLKATELKRFLAERANRYPPYADDRALQIESMPGAKSLRYLVKDLQDHGTRIVLINMPLHPLLSQIVPAERHLALKRFLDGLASPLVRIIDFQDKLPAEQFIDLVHVNADGREAFTTGMAAFMTKPMKLDSSTFTGTQSASKESLHAF